MMSDPIRDYARAVAEAVYEYCDRAWSLPGCWDRDKDDIMDEVFETVPRPTAQHHDAPTLTERDLRDIAEMKCITTMLYAKHSVPTPDTTEPAPDVQAQIDAAVARERERGVGLANATVVEPRDKFSLGWNAACDRIATKIRLGGE